MRIQLTFLLALALAAGACGDDDTTGTDSGPLPDSGDAVDAGTDTGAAMALACDWPTTGYGTAVMRKMEPFSLTTCDGTEFNYPNEDFCDTRFTVISIGAGWCGPCILETQQFEAEINERYDDADVRLVQILVADQDYAAPGQAFCEGWVARYGLTNVELVDPDGLTSIYFPAGALPSTIIVDNATGTIVFREVGASEGLLSLRAKLDDLLSE